MHTNNDDKQITVTIDKYFESWKNHDWVTLRNITTKNVIYQIEGRKTLNGHDEVEKYWSRNRDRQTNLIVQYHIVAFGDCWATCSFYSRFFNRNKKTVQVVFGLIKFQVDEAGIIKELSETYKKFPEETPHDPRPPHKRLYESVSRKIALRQNITSLWRKTSSLISAFIFLILPSAAILYCLVNYFPNISTPLVIFLASALLDVNLSIQNSYSEFLVKFNNVLSTLFAVSTIYYVAAEKISAFLGTRASVKRHKLRDRSEAAALMAKYLKSAKSVAVFSGDFDFFERDENLVDVFNYLESRGELSFYSERSSQEVMSAISELPKTRNIIRLLREKGRIYFSSNLKRARATYFESDGVANILNLPDQKTFLVLSGIDENEVALKMLKGAILERSSTHQVNDMSAKIQNSNVPKFIFVSGRTFSGKSTLSRALSVCGYSYISVSDTMKELMGVQHPSRQELIDFGKKLMSDNQGEQLFAAIKRKMLAGQPVVVDGLRPRLLLSRFQDEFQGDVLTIYCVVSQSIEKARYDAASIRNSETMSLAKIRNSDDQFGVEEIRDEVGTVIVSGVLSPNLVLEQLKPHIGTFKTHQT